LFLLNRYKELHIICRGLLDIDGHNHWVAYGVCRDTTYYYLRCCIEARIILHHIDGQIEDREVVLASITTVFLLYEAYLILGSRYIAINDHIELLLCAVEVAENDLWRLEGDTGNWCYWLQR
jgi:hypothetical protein